MFWIKMDSSLISLLQIVANVQESRSSECVAEVTNLGICSNTSSEPIIRNTDCWYFLPFAAILEYGFAKYSDLVYSKIGLSIWVWHWVEIRIVQEDYLDTFDHTFMYTKCASTTNININVVNVVNSILLKVAGLAFSVPLIVRRNDDNFLSKIGETNGKLINHNTETSNSGPFAQFWRGENNWSDLVKVMHFLSSSDWWAYLSARRFNQVAGHTDKP